MFGLRGKKTPADDDTTITDAVGSDPAALEKSAGVSGRLLIKSLDTAMGWQTSIIEAYVRGMRARHRDDSPDELQNRINDHFLTLVTGSGAAAGGAAVIPGVGFVTGLGAIAVESLAFLETAAWHTLASARLRGIDISEPERRRSLILVSILGSSGSALVAATMGGERMRDQRRKDDAGSIIAALGLPQLGGLNKQLLKLARKRVAKSARLAVVGKLMPMGIGAVLGGLANRRMGKTLIERTRTSLGPLPAEFDAGLEPTAEDERADDHATDIPVTTESAAEGVREVAAEDPDLAEVIRNDAGSDPKGGAGKQDDAT